MLQNINLVQNMQSDRNSLFFNVLRTVNTADITTFAKKKLQYKNKHKKVEKENGLNGRQLIHYSTNSISHVSVSRNYKEKSDDQWFVQKLGNTDMFVVHPAKERKSDTDKYLCMDVTSLANQYSWQLKIFNKPSSAAIMQKQWNDEVFCLWLLGRRKRDNNKLRIWPTVGFQLEVDPKLEKTLLMKSEHMTTDNDPEVVGKGKCLADTEESVENEIDMDRTLLAKDRALFSSTVFRVIPVPNTDSKYFYVTNALGYGDVAIADALNLCWRNGPKGKNWISIGYMFRPAYLKSIDCTFTMNDGKLGLVQIQTLK